MANIHLRPRTRLMTADTSAINHPHLNSNRPRSTDPLSLAYEESREQYRKDHPISTGEGFHQLSELRSMSYRDRIRLASPQQLEAHSELSTKPRIYIASKAKHRPRWREFRDLDDRFIGVDDPNQIDYPKHWKECVQDVKDCDVLVMYVETGEVMKGALIELGMALAQGKEIIVAGDLGDNGTWWHHPNVQVSDKSIEDLMLFIYGSDRVSEMSSDLGES
jgi:hypothetical protein